MRSTEIEPFTIDEIIIPKDRNSKSIILHVVQIIFVAVILGSLSLINYSSALFYWTIKAIQVVGFILIGALHLYLLQRQSEVVDSSFKTIKISLSLFFLIFLVLFSLYFFKAKSALVLSLNLSCAFLLPSIIFNSWLVFKDLFLNEKYKVWNKFERVSDSRVSIYLNSIPIKLKLANKSFDLEEEVYYSTMPGHIQFGQLFNKFLNNQKDDEAIELFDEDEIAYGWVFIQAKKGIGTKYIDPYLTLRENKIKDDSTIICVRVKEFKPRN